MSAERVAGPPRWAAPAALALVAVGLAVAAYLTLEHYSSQVLLACPDRGVVDCAKVTTSDQSRLLGVPVALLGLLWFAALVPLLLPAAWRRPRLAVPRLVAVGAGIPMVLYLVWTEAITLRALCLYCTAVHVVAVALFAVVALATALTEPADADRLSEEARS